MQDGSRSGTSAQLPSVLIIDDEEAIVQGITRWLGDSYRIARESDGADACGRLAAGERFSVIVCDLMMPDMTGMDLYEWMLGACPEQADRVLFMTAGTDMPHIQRFLVGMKGRVLAKPFQGKELIERVEALLAAGAVS